MRPVPRSCLSILLILSATVGAAAQPPADSAAPQALPPFEKWLAELREEALSIGIPKPVVVRTLTDVQPVAQILERDRTQAEFTLDLETYLKRRLTRDTIRTAQRMHTRHRSVLRRVEKEYGIPSRMLVAVWGLESNFGKFSGVRPTIPTLVTLAYDARRGAMFRGELFSALQIVSRGDIELERLKGSWAGALGQPQFMPSSYLKYAQDFDGDGRKDIWRSPSDVFASIANFLKQHGWARGVRWGREVRIPASRQSSVDDVPTRDAGCRAERAMTEARALDAWGKLGVLTSTAKPLPAARNNASLVSAGDRDFLVYENYEALLAYNCAHTYALSVALLSERIK